MKKIYPNKLKEGSSLRVFAPSRSLVIIDKNTREYANNYFKTKLKLDLSFSENIENVADFSSASVFDRTLDLHAGFSDKKIEGMITVIGGYNSNQLLSSIDWDIIRNNPKILCGFSDITALQNAIFAKTGLITYSGPHYITFGQKIFDGYTTEYFKKCLYSNDPYEIMPSEKWSNDKWFMDQDARNPIINTGFWMLQPGEATGTIVGGNLCTLNLLQGTEFMPMPNDIMLFIEDDEESYPEVFDRDLQSILHCFGERIKGLVIGRFQNESNVTREALTSIIATKKELIGKPVIANVDFGHTDPKITFPIGGKASLIASIDKISLVVLEH